MPRPLLVLPALAVLAISLASCEDEPGAGDLLDAELTALIESAVEGGTEALRLPPSDAYAAMPQDPRNPLTAEKVALGRLLFHETALATESLTEAMTGTYSCASCHDAATGFQAGRHQGIGDGGVEVAGEGRSPASGLPAERLDVQPLRTPSILHAGYQRVSLWSGQFGAAGPNADTEEQWTPGTPKELNRLGYEGVETQAIAGLELHRLRLDDRALDSLGYRSRFDAVFPDLPPADRYSPEAVGLAIAAYERTVIANRAPFQRWLAGETDALSPAEKRGAIAFFGTANCASCHTGPGLAGEGFHALGLDDLHDCSEETFGAFEGQAAHLGRGGFTMRRADMYAFKTPQLYNLADSRFYGHGASLRSLRAVIEYKNAAVPGNPRVPAERLAEGFAPLGLTEREVDDLVSFLEGGLRDPELERYGVDEGSRVP